MGLAGTLLLTAALGLVLAALPPDASRVAARRCARLLTRRALPAASAARAARGIIGCWRGGCLLRAACFCCSLLSVAPRWPYPALLPPALSGAGLAGAGAAPAPLWLSLALALAAAAVAVALCGAVVRNASRRRATAGSSGWRCSALALPQLASAGGQYRLFLHTGPHGNAAGTVPRPSHAGCRPMC